MHAPKGPDLSFRCTKFSKRNRLWSRRPPYEVDAPPPTGYPLSATVVHNKTVIWNIHMDIIFPCEPQYDQRCVCNHNLELCVFSFKNEKLFIVLSNILTQN